MSNETEVVTQETIKTKEDNNLEFVTMETVNQPNYDYGNGEQTLDYNVALRNKPTQSNSLLLIGM